MNKAKASLQKIKDPDEVKSITMEWFERENKPATAQSLTDALGSRVTKALVQKTLEDLLVQQKLQSKDLKKVRFFYLRFGVDGEKSASSDETAPAAQTNEEVEETEEADVDAEAGVDVSNGSHHSDRDETTEEERINGESEEKQRETLICEIVASSNVLQEKEKALRALMSVPTATERAARLESLNAEVSQLQSALETAEANAKHAVGSGAGCGGAGSFTEALNGAIFSYQRARLLWKERKDLTGRLIDGVLGDTCSSAELGELFGVTTDAAAGVSLAASAVQLPRFPPSTVAQ